MKTVAFVLLALLSATGNAVSFSSRVEQVPMIELYTSQGCSSCPPADDWLSGMTNHPGLWTELIPIAFHVDYWDYIGWRDRFASPNHGQRQRAYQRAGKVRSVYTPGLVVKGREWRGWFRGRKPDLVPGRSVGKLHLDLDGSQATIRFEPDGDAGNRPLQVHLALLGAGLSTPVGRGENEGKRLQEDFVVLGWTSTNGAGNGPWSLQLPETDVAPQRKAAVAWISAGDDPAPLQAVGGWLP